jgi:hypothetical protein
MGRTSITTKSVSQSEGEGFITGNEVGDGIVAARHTCYRSKTLRIQVCTPYPNYQLGVGLILRQRYIGRIIRYSTSQTYIEWRFQHFTGEVVSTSKGHGYR